jgi:competence ComEA-like helix-hairpin-helix protein
MHDSETRALRRAVVLLVLISVLRWGWTARPLASGGGEDSLLPELLDASRLATEEESRRAAPLASGELIDPNRADEVELDRLPGVGAGTARAIVAAREQGAVFRAPDDLLVVRGIGSATVERVRALLVFPDPPAPSRRSAKDPFASPGQVDLNSADLAGLMTLPGVGPAIAERILVARREQLFTSVEDLVRVRGIGPATVERLRPHATVGRQGPRS